MSVRFLSALAAVAALAAAGCVTPPAAELETASASLGSLLAAPESLWLDPQNAPHPAYNWPTLTNPAQGATVSPWWTPAKAAELPATITGIEQAVQVEGVASGAGIALFGSLAVIPGFGPVSYVVDISDPLSPKVLSEFEPTQGGHRGAAIVAYPDGRLVTALSTGPGFEVWDITDPTKPIQTAEVEAPTGGHKLGIVPGTPILYNANSGGGGSGPLGLAPTGHLPATAAGQTEIYDLTDPSDPVLVQEFKNGYGCHHIYFWNTAEKQRATCAGIEMTQIWDTADPLNPQVVVNVPVHHGVAQAPSASIFLLAFSHFAILNAAGDVLIVGDEMGGGSVPPGCSAPGAPTGALWFYDVSDETSPLLLGWFSPGTHLDANVLSSCTAHHGRLVPDPEGRDLLAMSFYGSGVVLVDFSDPKLPQIVDQFYENSNTWETWYYNGYLFTGDLNRGMDVLSFV